MIELLHMDCMEYMAGLEDNAFDLACVDPPYGIGAENHASNAENGWTQWEKKSWDSCIPSGEYFAELFRVSKNQIIWGGNYMTEFLPPKMCWLIWDKGQRGFSLADGEMAWTSFNKAMRIYGLPRVTATSYNKKNGGKIHPTQKPVVLYKWLLANYAKEGDRILDTHLGSGSSAIAAHYGGFDFVGMELDKDYYEAACKRLDQETAQLAMQL